MQYSLKVIQKWDGARQSNTVQKKLKRIASFKSRDRHQVADNVHQKVFNDFDCLSCANCCKTLPALISKRDIKRIAKHMDLMPAEFEDKYIRLDEDGDMVIDGAPCPFLQEDNKCSIYDVRPSACRQYPHSGESQFYAHIELHRKNIKHCPALFEIVNMLESD